jgi:hypothetical protein
MRLMGNLWGCTDDVAPFWPPGAVQLRLDAEPHALEKSETRRLRYSSLHASRPSELILDVWPRTRVRDTGRVKATLPLVAPLYIDWSIVYPRLCESERSGGCTNGQPGR